MLDGKPEIQEGDIDSYQEVMQKYLELLGSLF